MKRSPLSLAFLGSMLLAAAGPAFSAPAPGEPVTPNALPEVKALLQVLNGLSGHDTLTGQHNFPNTRARNSEFAEAYTGHPPAIFASDFGFAEAGNTDSYLARADIVQEAIRQHQRGALIDLCWHAAPPTANEPVTFRPLPGADPKRLASVQGQLTDEQFRDLLTPGTAIYQHWCAQVDDVARHLKALQDAHVPVLWRPYHEMNGDWFWWGGRTGPYSTAALYRQLFDRFVKVHQLTNLIWVWSVDRTGEHAREHAAFFPGLEYVDVVALDVYHSDFAQRYYDSLLALAGGKPIALDEVGNPPTPEILQQQPRWIYYGVWTGMVRNSTRKQYRALFRDPRVLNLDSAEYARIMEPYRRATGLPPPHVEQVAANFSGNWVLNEDASDLGAMGAGFAPARLQVGQKGNDLTVHSTRVVEWGDDQVTEDRLTLDGAEAHSQFMNAPRVTSARLVADGTELAMNSTVALPWAPPGSKMVVKDSWTLEKKGEELVIQRSVDSHMGRQETTLVFEKAK